MKSVRCDDEPILKEKGYVEDELEHQIGFKKKLQFLCVVVSEQWRYFHMYNTDIMCDGNIASSAVKLIEYIDDCTELLPKMSTI